MDITCALCFIVGQALLTLAWGELELNVVVRTNVWTVCGHIMCEEP